MHVGETGSGGVLPLRPMTVGELLDAALALLRTRARALLGLGLLLAAVEQAVLYPVREWSHGYGLHSGRVEEWFVLIATGLGTEAVAIAILGATAGAATVPAMFGRPVARPPRARSRAVAAVGVVALAAGLLTGIAALGLVLGWVFVYPLIGLAAPAVVIDRVGPGRALLRSAGLVLRSGLRPGVIRLLGYVGWLMFRLALALGGVAALGLIPGFDAGPLAPLLGPLAWLLVNALAYPVLGCLDAVLHVEARMRVEGFDIAAGRALRRGETLHPILAAPARGAA